MLTRMSAIAFIHRFRKVPDNSQHFLVRQSLTGYKKCYQKQDQRKPITISLLYKMCCNLKKLFTDV